MSLRQKTLIIFSATLIALFVILYVVSRVILFQSYEQLEKNRTGQNVQRLHNIVNGELDNLLATGGDYAFWDDTYEFAENRDESYIEENFVPETFINLGINFVIILDNEGQQIFKKAIDLQTGEELPFAENLNVFLTQANPVIEAEKGTSGLVLVDDTPVMIASQPILTNTQEGPARGALIFGRFLDETVVQSLSDAIELPITAHLYNALPAGDVANTLSVDSPSYVTPLNTEQIAGYGLITDITGQPALVLELVMVRDIYAQGESSLTLFAILFVGSGIIFGAVTLLLLEKTVLSRLTALNTNVGRIQSTRDIAARVEVNGDDEIASLAHAINAMLTTLDENQKNIREKDAQFQTFVHNAPILLWAVNTEQQITLLEGNAPENLNLDPHNAVGKAVDQVFAPEMARATDKALQGETIAEVVSVGGSTLDVRYTPLKDADGNVKEVIGVATDVTERVTAEKALGTAYRDLERQTSRLERAQSLYNSTLDHLSDTLRRGASTGEIGEYLDFMRAQFKSLERQQI